MESTIYKDWQEARRLGEKRFAVLIDPDAGKAKNLPELIQHSIEAGVDYFFVGGSLILQDILEDTINQLRTHCSIPIVLFPGSPLQVSSSADALLLLSLISGRNADLLIGRHVEAAPMIARSGLEIMPTGYMLIDGGASTSASYMSNTTPIPANKPDIALCTALAGQLLGLKTIYMDAGSGAQHPVSESMIQAVSQNIDIPLVVGGGIRTPAKVALNAQAGADIIVVGNALERDSSILNEMVAACKQYSTSA